MPASVKPAAWSVAVPARHVEKDGKATVVATLSDAASSLPADFTITVSVTADRQLLVLCEVAEGAAPLSDFQAWSTR